MANKVYFKIIRKLFLCALPITLIFVICSYISMGHGKVAYADEVSQSSDNTAKRIYDEAGLLSDSELEELEALCNEYGEKAGIEIFILTHNDKKSTYPEKYIEDFEDKLPVADRVYFLYDLYRNEIFIEGYGLAETYIHSKRIDKIFDNMVDDLKSGNYFDAFKTYITQAAAYMEDDSEINTDHNYIYDTPPQEFDSDNEYTYDDGYDYDKYYKEEQIKDNILFNFWFQLIVSVLIGATVVGIMAYNSGGRMTAGANNYVDRSKSGIIGSRDQYMHTTVTKRRKPTTDGQGAGGTKSRGGFNASGFRGGTSSGGRSHSSGGRKL